MSVKYDIFSDKIRKKEECSLMRSIADKIMKRISKNV